MYHATLKRIPVVEEYRGDPDNAHIDAGMFTIIIRRRESKTVSDGLKQLKLKFFKMILSEKKLYEERFFIR